MLAPVLRRSVIQQRSALRYTLSSLPALARWYASFPPHTVVRMPALSPTMTAGNIGAWQKKPGDTIAPGEVLVEIETDKAQMDFEFQDEGVLAKILKETGEKDVPVGNPIAVLVEEGTDIKAFEGFTVADAGGEAAPAAAKEEKKEEPAPTPSPASELAPAPTPAPEPADEESSGKLVPSYKLWPRKAVFRAEKVFREAKEELAKPLLELEGTGENGLLTEEDIKKFMASRGTAGAAPAGAGAVAPQYEDIATTGMRRTIASRLKQSWQENPHYFVSSSLSVSKLLKLRQSLNSSAEGKYKLSVNDFLIKAMAVACKKVPQVNSSWREDAVRQYSTVDVSVAVATPVGLITPIVKAVDTKGLESISASVKELAKRARDGKLKPEEYQGGTISISNMGMNPAVSHFTAIINPPQAAILAVGSTQKVAVPSENEDGTTAVEWDDQIMVTASFDHRVVDGAVGAEWMRALKRAIENPLELLL